MCFFFQKRNASSINQVHCRLKNKLNWCLDEIQSPMAKILFTIDRPFSNDSDQPIQIKPQHQIIRLRRGEKFNLKFHYKMTENFPVDLYYVMDLSHSMKEHKNKLADLGNDLAKAMRQLTTNFRLGFGSFIDKVELPYTSTSKQGYSIFFFL